MPKKQPLRRLWLTDGSCIRLRAENPHHVWAYDVMATRTEEGRPVKRLTIVEADTRECLAIDVEQRLRSDGGLHRLTKFFVQQGVPAHIRSDNGSGCAAKAARHWLRRVVVQTLCVTPGNPWENRYIEHVTGTLCEARLDRELFATLREVKGLTERCRQISNQIRPHRSEAIAPQCA